MTKKRLAVDFDLASQNLELIDAVQGASLQHITWSGVDLARPNSSLLNITFYDNAGSIVKFVEESLRYNFAFLKFQNMRSVLRF